MKNERGSTIVAALLILVLLTIIGIAAINSSTTERDTSANYLLYERVFFSAEAGLEHAKAALQNYLTTHMPPGGTGTPKFGFALAEFQSPGTTLGSMLLADWKKLSTFPPSSPFDNYKNYFGSAITNSPLQGYRYTIYLWDNKNDGDAALENDGTVYMLAQADGPKNSRCSIFATLEANADSNPLSGYNAQEGAGPGKGYSSLDKGGVANFNAQVGRSGGLVLH